ncbi:hypothetical protein LguiA_021503 [Lonicera macranthoides]
MIYSPQVSNELMPKKGQQFETIYDVVKFYNAYSKVAGLVYVLGLLRKSQKVVK